MQITRQADYALRAILYLSNLEPSKRAATSHIAKEKKYSAVISGENYFSALNCWID